jgi:hypothetical protein
MFANACILFYPLTSKFNSFIMIWQNVFWTTKPIERGKYSYFICSFEVMILVNKVQDKVVFFKN